MAKFKISFPKLPKIFLKPIPRLTPTTCLGIDIGTSVVKVVELSRVGGGVRLNNYGEIPALAIYEKPSKSFDKNALLFSDSEIGKVILAILEEAKIQTKSAVFTIPDFSTFFTNIELPKMTRKEIPKAVNFAAPQYIPTPLSSVTLDWQITNDKAGSRSDRKIRILLVAVPNEVINQYKGIAKIINIDTKFLEAEVFALLRSLNGNDKITLGLVEIGAQSTTCSIVDNGILKTSHSLDVAGNEMTHSLANGLGLDYKVAEKLKKKHGISPISKESSEQGNQDTASALLPSVDTILVELQRIFNIFTREENKEITKIVLAGGGALIPGIVEYFSSVLKKEVEIIDPFSNIFYPPVLDKTLKNIGPRYAVAIGAALRGIE